MGRVCIIMSTQMHTHGLRGGVNELLDSEHKPVITITTTLEVQDHPASKLRPYPIFLPSIE